MIKKRFLFHLGVLVAGLLASGCASKSKERITMPKELRESRADLPTAKPYQLKISPIVGSRSDDSRIIRDFGVIQKVWFAPYEDKNDNLIAAHDVYVVIQEPRWVVGSGHPLTTKSTGMMNAAGKLPFIFRNDELDFSSDTENGTLKNYINRVYEMEKKGDLPKDREEKIDEYDKTILEFIQNNTKEKEGMQ